MGTAPYPPPIQRMFIFNNYYFSFGTPIGNAQRVRKGSPFQDLYSKLVWSHSVVIPLKLDLWMNKYMMSMVCRYPLFYVATLAVVEPNHHQIPCWIVQGCYFRCDEERAPCCSCATIDLSGGRVQLFSSHELRKLGRTSLRLYKENATET